MFHAASRLDLIVTVSLFILFIFSFFCRLCPSLPYPFNVLRAVIALAQLNIKDLKD